MSDREAPFKRPSSDPRYEYTVDDGMDALHSLTTRGAEELAEINRNLSAKLNNIEKAIERELKAVAARGFALMPPQEVERERRMAKQMPELNDDPWAGWRWNIPSSSELFALEAKRKTHLRIGLEDFDPEAELKRKREKLPKKHREELLHLKRRHDDLIHAKLLLKRARGPWRDQEEERAVLKGIHLGFQFHQAVATRPVERKVLRDRKLKSARSAIRKAGPKARQEKADEQRKRIREMFTNLRSRGRPAGKLTGIIAREMRIPQRTVQRCVSDLNTKTAGTKKPRQSL